MRYGSLFSGAGGFDLGLDRAGMTCVFQCEVDKQARAVLRHHWPEVPKYEDVRELTGRTLPRVDLLVGGFPCQDVSVAGNRAGLAGKRTGLFYEFIRLVSELAPEWILLENVPGLLSSGGGRDMGAVLGTMGELGYGWAYRSLDAQYFGVPQRRERLFIVGRAGGRSPVEVLFESESVQGNPPPRREAREDVAGTFTSGSGGGRYGKQEHVARPLTAPVRRQDGETESFVVGALAANMGQGNQFAMSGQYVAHPLRADGFDASEDGTGRGTPLVAVHAWGLRADASRTGEAKTPSADANGRIRLRDAGFNILEEQSPTLDASAPHTVAFDWYASLGQGMPVSSECPPLRTTMQPAIAQAMGVRRLTPTECERLMGWPDGHTSHGVTDDDKRVTMADGPRYRMCGNGVVSNVAEWIGKRMVAVMG